MVQIKKTEMQYTVRRIPKVRSWTNQQFPIDK
jgi:hypothetical protein